MKRVWMAGWVAASICLLNSSGRAQATQEDLKARFLAEAPKEWARLEAAVGLWQGSFKETIHFAATDAKPAHDRHRLVSYWSNHDVGGLKIVTTIEPDDGRLGIEVTNPHYDFRLTRAKPDQKPFLVAFASVKKDGSRDESLVWSRVLTLTNWLLIAESLTNAPLRQFTDGEVGEVRSVTTINSDRRELVKIEFQQFEQPGKKPAPYPAWVLVDPKQHWAIVAYDRQDAGGGYRGRVEYQPQITNVSFPQKVVEEIYGLDGKVEREETREFDVPKPCTLSAHDFELEAFGLERPK